MAKKHPPNYETMDDVQKLLAYVSEGKSDEARKTFEKIGKLYKKRERFSWEVKANCAWNGWLCLLNWIDLLALEDSITPETAEAMKNKLYDLQPPYEEPS